MQPAPRSSRLRLARAVARVVMAIAMVGASIQHFRNPGPFIRIVPAWLPAPALLVALSGAAELALGLAVLVPSAKVRRWAGYGLVALLVAVFPANVNMAIHQIQLSEGGTLPVWVMWARLPLQALFVGWALWATTPDAAPLERAS